MKKLEKILGKKHAAEIGERCEEILRSAYKRADQGRVYVGPKEGDSITEITLSVLENLHFLHLYQGTGSRYYRITRKGMEKFDSLFRKEGEIFGVHVKIAAITAENKK